MEQQQHRDPVKGMALGLVSTRSFPAIIGTADMMLKCSGVTLVGFEKIGNGHCTAIVRGGISDVRLAVEAGAETAAKFGQLVSSSIIARPLPNLEAIFPIGSRLLQYANGQRRHQLGRQAIGLVETMGFPAMVGAADMMLKTAEVHLAAYEVIGAGLCTAIIRGAVADVAMAVEAGMHEAERIGGLTSVMVIPRPLDDMENSLPIADCWLEQPVPLRMPLVVKDMAKPVEERELVELPAAAVATPLAMEAQMEPQRERLDLSTPWPAESPVDRQLPLAMEPPISSQFEDSLEVTVASPTVEPIPDPPPN
jgi:carbon dioxide concentrating mechanism protein CcmO